MQTVDDFIKQKELKESQCTVISWCEKKYIPGAKKDRGIWLIPEGAEPPYTKRRYKRGTSPLFSMVNGCMKQKHIVAALYGLEEERFQSYINNLVTAGFISVYKGRDGYPHYTETPKGKEAVEAGSRGFLKKFNSAIGVITSVAEVAVSLV